MWIPVITILWALGDNATWVNFPMVNFPFTSSTFKTNILSVDIPKTSFALIFLGEKLPATSILVTIPVTPVVPSPTFKVNCAVLNPIRCLPSSLLKVSVDKPETLITSPILKSCG